MNPWAIPIVNDELVKLHGEGVSFTGIAEQLNAKFDLRLTRNSCIGRAHRLGLELRPSPVKRAAPLTAEGRPLLDLGWRDCRWPLGELLERPKFFCGHPVKQGSAWCEAHHRRAYQRGGY